MLLVLQQSKEAPLCNPQKTTYARKQDAHARRQTHYGEGSLTMYPHHQSIFQPLCARPRRPLLWYCRRPPQWEAVAKALPTVEECAWGGSKGTVKVVLGVPTLIGHPPATRGRRLSPRAFFETPHVARVCSRPLLHLLRVCFRVCVAEQAAAAPSNTLLCRVFAGYFCRFVFVCWP